jgi:predicted dehydrogenase
MMSPVMQALEEMGRREARQFRDFRELIESPLVDAVVVATPDHQHFPMAACTMEAKKPLYLEVPVTHSPEEAQQLLGLQTASGVLVQTGLTHRSGPHFLSAIRYLRSGHLGHIHLAKAWATHRRQSIGRKAESTPPAEADYAAWLGPDRQLAYRSNRFHYHWRWHWELGAGELGNWGVHLLDLACWGLEVTHPTRVTSTGGKFAFDDDQQTPDTQQVYYEFGHCAIQWEHRQWSPHANEGRSSGVAFYGERGTLILDRGGWKVYGVKKGDSRSGAEATSAHCRNFLDAIRGSSVLAADLATGTTASNLCHAGNAAYLSHQL